MRGGLTFHILDRHSASLNDDAEDCCCCIILDEYECEGKEEGCLE